MRKEKEMHGTRISKKTERQRQDSARFLGDWRGLSIIIILGLVVITIPHLNRVSDGNNNLIGETAYYNMRVAEEIASSNNIGWDELSYAGSLRVADPYQFLLAMLEPIADLKIVSIVLPLFFGLISLLLISVILDRLKTSPLLKALILIMIVLSPIFIYTFAISTKYTFIITLIACGFYFYLKERPYNLIIATTIFFIVALFGIFETMLVLAVLFVYIMVHTGKKDKDIGKSAEKKTEKEEGYADTAAPSHDKRRWFNTIALVLVATAICYGLFIGATYPNSVRPDFVDRTLSKNTISDFGSDIGIGFFKFMLMMIGFVVLWKEREKNKWVIILMILLLVSVLFIRYEYIVFATFMLAYFAAVGFESLIRRRWEVDILKHLTIITLFSGILFSSVSYITVISESEPSPAQSESLLWMKDNLEEGVVLSHYSNGFWIESIAGMPAFMDSNFRHNPDINTRYYTSQKIFGSRNMDVATDLLERNHISYIWIDNDMKEGEIWSREEEGLLFLFRNNETFRRVYSSSGIDIIQVVQKGPG